MPESLGTEFKISGWDEKPAQEMDGDGKIVIAHVTQNYTGELEGEGRVEYVMYYLDKTHAVFSGYETFEGQFRGSTGRFVMTHKGHYSGGNAKSEWEIVPGSSAGELQGLTGSGTFNAGEGGKAEVKLNLKSA
ncbi:MAG: DUF3224 domain-containing protein [Gammaproteobacteria bacterium]|nr:DUF3224 domain-containing protein [Gammaproteobacteria bacterium]